MMIRFFDILFSLAGLIILSPLFLILSIWIMLDSRGGGFFFQERIGRYSTPFRLIKFRTMVRDSERKGGLTIGANDSRITKAGLFLRKHKLDELPQLVNVLKGEMSFVGPRPELKKYVDHYTEKQMEILRVRPGITDLASLKYFRENELLGASQNPEKTYLEEIMPEKIELNREYMENPTLSNYFSIIFKTIGKIIKPD
jgi:lipopolysaccharide/colanic/teichoic acid biosynthesis glycosyltransferase